MTGDSRTKTVFFPYIYGDETLQIELSRCELDAKPFEAGWNSDLLECDLSTAGSWDSAVLTFKIKRSPSSMWVPELLPGPERKAPPVSLVAGIHCPSTFRRFGSKGSLDIKAESGEVEVRLRRNDVRGSVDLNMYVVRTSTQSAELQLARDAGARLIASRRVSVRIDAAARRLGPGLTIEWEGFRMSKHKYRASNSSALFHLDTSGAEPILFLNKDADGDLYAVLNEEAPRGRKAALRNLIFSAIALPVWTCLLRTALGAVDSEGNIDPGWQRNVIAQVGSAAEPDCDRQEAIKRLIRDLKDSAGGHAIEERLPVIVAKMVEFRDKAEEMVGVLL